MQSNVLAGQVRAFAVTVFAVIICAFLASCSSEAASSSSAAAEGQPDMRVAATILGEDITEQQITDYVNDLREGTLHSDDEAWRAYLQESDMTIEDIRKVAIDELASTVVIRQKAAELGLVVDEDAVTTQIEGMRTSLAAEDDEAWTAALSEYRTTPEKLRETFETKNLQQQLYEALVDEVEPTDDQVVAYIDENLLGQTAKKLFIAYGSDYQEMSSLLDEMKQAASGEEAKSVAQEWASDGRANVSEYGWYFSGSATTQMENEIADLDKGAVSDSLLPYGDQFQILYVEDEYTFLDAKQAMSAAPADLLEGILLQVAPDAWEEACNAWLHEQIDENIIVNETPSDLPYDVDDVD